MFFIPIAAVVIVFWIIINSVQEGRLKGIQNAGRREVERSQRLRAVTYDGDAAYIAEMRMRQRHLQAKEIVNFMGGGKDWERYTGNLDKGSILTLSLIAALAPQGKLTMLCMGIGFRLYGRNPSSMGEKEWRSMTEQFLLHAEDVLNKKGIPAVDLCRRGWSGSNVKNACTWQNLRQYIAKYGAGSTEAFEYVFTSKY